MNSPTYSPERLAYWYLRLNGFLTTENFVVHPDAGTEQRTEADLLGVRFLYRAENPPRPMTDDPVVSEGHEYCKVVIAEVKRGTCSLNGPWTDPSKKNLHLVLAGIGCIPDTQVEQAAKHLYRNGRYEGNLAAVQLLAFGDRRGSTTPNVPQILFTDMLQFIHNRFDEYDSEKASVGNWADDGRRLRELASEGIESFVAKARLAFGLPSQGGT